MTFTFPPVRSFGHVVTGCEQLHRLHPHFINLKGETLTRYHQRLVLDAIRRVEPNCIVVNLENATYGRSFVDSLMRSNVRFVVVDDKTKYPDEERVIPADCEDFRKYYNYAGQQLLIMRICSI